MLGLPLGTVDFQSADAWFAALAERLEKLLGAQGAEAVLCRALLDARRRCPELNAVVSRTGGLDLSGLYPLPCDWGTEDLFVGESLSVLAESLCTLLTSLLGEDLTSQLMSSPDDIRERLGLPSCSSLLCDPA